MAKTKLILLGGFLGSGKTTLMVNAAEQLRKEGLRVACVTNDQSGNLVDSKLVLVKELPLQQIGGGCFCCRFEDLTEAIGRLMEKENPDVIIAEAVGSCTDLVATVVKPLLQFHGDRLDVRPLTVVIDPDRYESYELDAGAPLGEDVAYLYGKQIEEAGCVVLNKTDTLTAGRKPALLESLSRRFSPEMLLDLSALRPGDAKYWIEILLMSGTRLLRSLELDYDRYADGEAQLGWLNADIRLEGVIPRAGQFCHELVMLLADRFAADGQPIAHLKLWAQCGTDSLKISVVGSVRTMRTDHNTSDEWPADRLALRINARVNGRADKLKETVVSSLQAVAERWEAAVRIEQLDCFSPARPEPSYRMA